MQGVRGYQTNAPPPGVLWSAPEEEFLLSEPRVLDAHSDEVVLRLSEDSAEEADFGELVVLEEEGEGALHPCGVSDREHVAERGRYACLGDGSQICRHAEGEGVRRKEEGDGEVW